MPESIRLIVGLGNPGARYRDTWHNLGFKVVEELADRWKCSFKPGKGEFLSAQAAVHEGIVLMMPTTFMNRSGDAVGAWTRYFKVTAGSLLIVFDDHDLPLGKIRIREEGSAGGHKGMEDIIRALGVDKIPRIRIGIRTQDSNADLADRVLRPIPPNQATLVGNVIDTVADATEFALNDGILAAMNRYNRIDIQ